jgi:hypothetical protein
LHDSKIDDFLGSDFDVIRQTIPNNNGDFDGYVPSGYELPRLHKQHGELLLVIFVKFSFGQIMILE